ncbi:uncharacterized protein LOC131014789 [Salvia miltiorrhiza]|uniref:uncharacterized protein LOC131014789 n=1 Tax=Salvia miltiorrhiza TaxID=226208 RepID=UPI0025AC7A9D|nr:uncharacterized protein LOC131014789 [Salvia miltiorrhiza]
MGDSPEKGGGKGRIKWGDPFSKGRAAVESLGAILRYFPPHLSSSETPATSLLQDPDVATQISTLLRRPDSGAVNDNLCAWLYDTFHSADPSLQLVVLRFLPILAGVYLTRAALNKPLPGFESVLLAIYAHETAARNGQAATVSIPDLGHPSVYHEAKQPPAKNASTELHLAVITPSLEPHGTVRSTRRAKIVGVALELYYSRISLIPVGSKLDFCDFCRMWSGHDPDGRRGRINLPWELMQPILRILGHCLFRPAKNYDLFQAAFAACQCMNARAQHDMNAKAMLATASLVRLAHTAMDPISDVDHTELPITNQISV